MGEEHEGEDEQDEEGHEGVEEQTPGHLVHLAHPSQSPSTKASVTELALE